MVSIPMAFPAPEPGPGSPRPLGHVVLEATNIIAARKGRIDSFLTILQAAHPEKLIEEVLGPRNYARVKIRMDDGVSIKETIKDIARARGKRTTIKTVERVFYSPRD